ncbi:Scr1 family TA system antitoxin-like transcriptional regulator [Streptomyces sp. NPDC101249]|uniref:Scr1 family TA system antitoxin-like transcriptional regulator n=1 Tax=Streptomyces sp. NPDC101249 TaxID=3366140 RepID=UPI0038079703
MLAQTTPGERAPVLVVLGSWLRSLRLARQLRLLDVARPGISPPTLHRWELGCTPAPDLVGEVLASYGVADEEIEWMISQIPSRSRGKRSCPVFTDWGGTCAQARFTAVQRLATDAVEFGSVLLPTSVRTREYAAAVAAPGRTSARTPEQHRVVLVDEAVLYRPVAGPSVMYRQLSHLLTLLDSEHPHPDMRGGVRVRVVPEDAPPRPFQDAGPIVWMTALETGLLCRPGTAPSYLAAEAQCTDVVESLLDAARTLGREPSRAAVARAQTHQLSVLRQLPAPAVETASGGAQP